MKDMKQVEIKARNQACYQVWSRISNRVWRQLSTRFWIQTQEQALTELKKFVRCIIKF